MLAIARLQVRQILAGQRRWILLLLLAAPIALVATIAFGARPPEIVKAVILFAFYAIGVCGMTALLYATAVIGSEVQGQTLTYLFTRATPRWRVLFAKFGANVAVIAAGVLASLTVSWALLASDRPSLLAGLAAGVVAATIAYNAMLTLLGSIFTRKTLVIGLIYLVLETLLALVPASVRSLTIMYWVRCLANDIADIRVPGQFDVGYVIGDATGSEACTVLALITVTALAIAAFITTRREFALTDEP